MKSDLISDISNQIRVWALIDVKTRDKKSHAAFSLKRMFTGHGKRMVVEGGTTRGTTALVYLQLHSSLYTGTVHVLSSVVGVHPTSDR